MNSKYITKRLEEFEKEFAHVKETDRHYHNPWIPEMKSFLIKSIQQAVAEERARAVGEGVHLGVNNFETWMKQYHEDKDFVGSFGDWIDKLLTSTQEKD